jgi:hypothetical protein
MFLLAVCTKSALFTLTLTSPIKGEELPIRNGSFVSFRMTAILKDGLGEMLSFG